MSVFYKGMRIGKPADPIGTVKHRKDGMKWKKTESGWEPVGKVVKGVDTKVVKRRKRMRYL